MFANVLLKLSCVYVSEEIYKHKVKSSTIDSSGSLHPGHTNVHFSESCNC